MKKSNAEPRDSVFICHQLTSSLQLQVGYEITILATMIGGCYLIWLQIGESISPVLETSCLKLADKSSNLYQNYKVGLKCKKFIKRLKFTRRKSFRIYTLALSLIFNNNFQTNFYVQSYLYTSR